LRTPHVSEHLAVRIPAGSFASLSLQRYGNIEQVVAELWSWANDESQVLRAAVRILDDPNLLGATTGVMTARLDVF
jgi:hypothetical protein